MIKIILGIVLYFMFVGFYLCLFAINKNEEDM